MFARKETDDDHEAIGGGGGHGGGPMGRMSTLGVVPGNDGIRRARDAIQCVLKCHGNCHQNHRVSIFMMQLLCSLCMNVAILYDVLKCVELRPSFGIFDRAGFGTVAFRRDSMAATLFAVQNDDR